MSNALAIAAVTETLVQTLETSLSIASHVPNAFVTSVTPDKTAQLPNPGVNIFLYQVTPNTAFRNADLPTRAADGTLLRKPQIALDLHYLFTFYGDDTALEPQRLLGAVTLALHASPVLARNSLQPAPIAPIHQGQAPGATFDSQLSKQSQLIRLFPVTFTIEEMSKIWSFLLKVDYVLSAAYIASVVLMQPDDPEPAPAPPVLSYSLSAAPLRQPVISRIAASPDPSAPILAGAQIAISGANFDATAGSTTEVMIGGGSVAPALVSANKILLILPAGLAAGVQTAQVRQPASLGAPPLPHPGVGPISPVFPFMLAPSIAPSSPPSSIRLVTTPGSPPGHAIEVDVIPTARAGQRALVLLSQSAPPTSRLIDGGTLPADADTLSFPLPPIASGTYFVQILVDGAQSALVTGPGGTPVGPTIHL
jgi:hypothetical protein